MSFCAACRLEKDNSLFHRNRSTKTGFDFYCKECRGSWYKNGNKRAWADRRERAEALIASGLTRCSRCKETLPLERFYKSTQDFGYSRYCIVCLSKRNKAAFALPEAKARAAAYYGRDDVKLRERQRKQVTPRAALSASLNRALKRRATDNPASIDDLVDLWRRQNGWCALSGMKMTWASLKTLPTSISIDRIDNAQGYSLDNIRLICTAINYFRGRWDDEHVIAMANAIVSQKSACVAGMSSGLLAFGA